MPNCRQCNQPVSPSDVVCSSCGCSVNLGRLAGPEDDNITRGARESLALVRADALLDRQDSSASLTRDLCDLSSSALAPAEIDGMLDRLEGDALPSLGDLERLIVSGGDNQFAIEGIALSEILDHGVDARDLLRKGMLFLRNGRHREALEWWTLNRRRLESQNAVDLLLLIMELLTCTMMKDSARAGQIRQEIRLHPFYGKVGRKRPPDGPRKQG